MLDEPAVDIEAILDVTHRYILAVPTFMPLAGCASEIFKAPIPRQSKGFSHTYRAWLLGVGGKLEFIFRHCRQVRERIAIAMLWADGRHYGN